MRFRPERFPDTEGRCWVGWEGSRRAAQAADTGMGLGSQRDEVERSWAARDAEIAARQTTRRILGASAHRVWQGRTNGTAVGRARGLVMTWSPPKFDGPEYLTLHRDCPTCGARWSTAVLSRNQLLATLLTDRCACRRVDEASGVGGVS